MSFKIENGVLKEYLGKDAEITVPDGVTEIAENVFEGCKKLKRITLPASLTVIGAWAFCGCKKLTEVTFANGSCLQTIGDQAFFGCERMAHITIPASLTSIGKYAFARAYFLESVTFSVKLAAQKRDTAFRCDMLPFLNCRRLEQICVPTDMEAAIRENAAADELEQRGLAREIVVRDDL